MRKGPLQLQLPGEAQFEQPPVQSEIGTARTPGMAASQAAPPCKSMLFIRGTFSPLNIVYYDHCYVRYDHHGFDSWNAENP